MNLPSLQPEKTQLRRIMIHHIDRLSVDVVRLQLRVIDPNPLTYQAGQYLAIHLPNGVMRCYSMARRQEVDAPLEFHIRLHNNGVFSNWIVVALNTHKANEQTLSVSGPFGDCIWRTQHQPSCTTIMLGSGTGIAPLSALIDEALANDPDTPIALYWGGRQANDFYCRNHFETLAQEHKNFRFVPVADTTDSSWNGRRGFVQDCAAADFPNLQNANVYACGSPIMVDSARKFLLAKCALDPDHFFADAFEPSISLADALQTEQKNQVQLRHVNGTEQTLTLPGSIKLMSALHAEGLMQGICGGQKSCGSCRIEIDPTWASRLPPAEKGEARLLAALNAPHPQDRLACQITLTPALDGLRIAIPDRHL